MPCRYVEFCTQPGCFAKTREGKPYCIDHILEQDYPRKIQAAIALRDEELAGIAKGERVEVTGAIALEVLAYLMEIRSATVERIARERGYTHSVSLQIVEALAGAGLVKTGHTTRGSIYAQFLAHPSQRSERDRRPSEAG